MKRYNIHFDEDWIKELDQITVKVAEEMGGRHYWTGVARADIVRVGLAIAFNLNMPYVRHSPEDLIKITKAVIKKRVNRKGV